MSFTSTEAPLSHDDQGLNYRAVSGLAITALVFGLLSATALLGPVLWFVPLVAAVLAVAAMRRVTASGGELAGWNLALLALLLAVLFGVAGPARTISFRHWINTKAEFVANEYINLLQKHDGYKAHQLTFASAARKPLGPGLEKVYETDADLKQRYQEFAATEPVKTLLEHGKSAKVEHLATELLSNSRGRQEVAVVYRITPATAGGRPSDYHIILRRGPGAGHYEEDWQVVPSSNSHLHDHEH